MHVQPFNAVTKYQIRSSIFLFTKCFKFILGLLFENMNTENSNETQIKKSKQGRPRKIDRKLIFDTLQKYKKKISPSEDGKLVSKSDKVWKEIAKEIKNIKSDAGLYTYVSCNQDGVRKALWMNFENHESSDDPMDDYDRSDLVKDLLEVSTLSCNADQSSNAFTFTIHVPASELDKLVETRVVYLHKKRARHVKNFLKGPYIIEKSFIMRCGNNLVI